MRGKRTTTFPTTILLATDGSEDSTLAAQAAADLADKTNSEFHLVHARDVAAPTHYYPRGAGVEQATFAEEVSRGLREIELLDRQLREVEGAGGEVVHKHHRIGPAATQIVAVSEEIEAGLIVMGSRGLRGLERMVMGSVSESVVRHAHCPVMVVRQEPGQQ